MEFTFRDSEIPLDVPGPSSSSSASSTTANICRALQFHSEIDEEALPKRGSASNENANHRRTDGHDHHEDDDSEEVGDDGGGDAIKIYLRVRPGPISDRYHLHHDGKHLEVVRDDNENASRSFTRETRHRFFQFTKIFQNSAQSLVFDTCALPLVCNVLRGMNSLIFTYGVTSSGKTYTMRGTGAQPGLVPHAIASIFVPLKGVFDLIKYPVYKVSHTFGDSVSLDRDQQQREDDRRNLLTEKAIEKFSDDVVEFNKFELDFADSNPSMVAQLKEAFTEAIGDEPDKSDMSVWISYYEIYNEQIFDLLDLPELGPKQKLEPLIGGGVKNLTSIFVTSPSEAFMVYLWGQKNLSAHMARTNLNQASSRSHSIFQISLIKTDLEKQCRITSNIAFCDLAGSERAKKTQSSGGQIREASQINKSLMHLRQCIQKESSKQRGERQLDHYRDSKLTMVLRPYLTGNEGHTCIIANLNPCDNLFDESFHSLQFCLIASTIEQTRLAGPKNVRRLTVHEEVEEDEDMVDEEAVEEEEQENVLLEDLRKTLREREAKIEELRGRLKCKNEELNQVRSGYSVMIEGMEEDYEEEMVKKDAELAKTIEEYADRLAQSEARYQSLLSEVKSQKDESFESQLFQANSRIAELEAAMETMEGEQPGAKELTSASFLLKLNNEEYRVKIEKLSAENAELKSSLTSRVEEVEQLKATLLEQKKESAARIATISLEKANSEARVKGLQEDRKNLSHQLGLVRLSMGGLRNNLNDVTTTYENSLKNLNVEHSKRTCILKKQITNLTEENERLKSKIELLSKEKSAADARVKSFEDEICSMNSKLDSTTSAEMTTLKAENQRLVHELEHVREQLSLKRTTMEMQKNRLESEVKTLEEKVVSLEAKKNASPTADELRCVNQGLKLEIAGLRSEKLMLEAKVQELQMAATAKQTQFHNFSDRSLDQNVDSNSPMPKGRAGKRKNPVVTLGMLEDRKKDGSDDDEPVAKQAKKKITHFHDLSDRSLEENIDPMGRKSPTPKKKGGRKRVLDLPKSLIESLSKRPQESVLKPKQYSVKKTMPKRKSSLEMFSPETFMKQEEANTRRGYNTRQRSKRKLF